jgi:transcriptional regulator with XRE-family HTH domain
VPYENTSSQQACCVALSKRVRSSSLEEAFGRVLAKHREIKGLSQMDLAVTAGYSLRYVGDVERGTKSATLRTVNDFATLLGVQLSVLITEAESLLRSERPKLSRQVANSSGR